MIFSAGPIVKLGFIRKPHGYDGRLKIEFTSDQILSKEEPVFLMIQERPVPFFLQDVEGRDLSIIRLKSVDTFEEAERLTGLDLFISGSPVGELSEEGVIGYSMVDDQLGLIGTVLQYIDNGAQQLIVVEYQNRQCLIPFVTEILYDIDPKLKQIKSRLPEGLLDIEVASGDENETSSEED